MSSREAALGLERLGVHPSRLESISRAFRDRARRWIVHRALRIFMAIYAVAMRLARVVGPARRQPPAGSGHEILLTGTFYSDNWLRAFLAPMAASKGCARIRMVAVHSVPAMDKVEAIGAPRWLVRLVGGVPARLITFAWVGLRTRPHVVGGFHLLVNGLAAALVARIIGGRSLYYCVGGPVEVIDGGIWTENRVFGRLETPDAVIERRLLRAVDDCDLVVTMGGNAIRFFRERGVATAVHAVPAGIDARRFARGGSAATTDLIWVGRMAPIKRVDLLLHAVAVVARTVPTVHATLVGDGELREELEALVRELHIEANVAFVGRQTDVEAWLGRARVFVLTSDSEGLSLSLTEAMLCGLPAVVSDVGDLAEVVEDGVSGYLVRGRSPDAFASPILALLTDPDRLARFSAAARRSAERFDTDAIARRWDEVLAVERR